MSSLGQRVSQAALITAALMFSVASSGCGSQDPCAASEQFQTPLSATDSVALEALKEQITNDAVAAPASGIVLVDVDQARGVVNVGVLNRTPELCAELHRRYGPRVTVIDRPGAGA